MSIPRRIWQTCKSHKIPNEARQCIESWRDRNPGFNQQLHDDLEAGELIRQHFGTELFQVFQRVPIGVMRGDIWRYAVLYVHGGIYCDIDTECLVPVDDWPTMNKGLVLALENDVHFCQWTIAARSGHPALAKVLDLIVQRWHSPMPTSYPHYVHYHSGPGIWSSAIAEYLGQTDADTQSIYDAGNWQNKDIHILDSNAFSGEYVRHHFGSQVWRHKEEYCSWLDERDSHRPAATIKPKLNPAWTIHQRNEDVYVTHIKNQQTLRCNESAFALINYCSGEHTIQEIVTGFQTATGGDSETIEREVLTTLAEFVDRGLLTAPSTGFDSTADKPGFLEITELLGEDGISPAFLPLFAEKKDRLGVVSSPTFSKSEYSILWDPWSRCQAQPKVRYGAADPVRAGEEAKTHPAGYPLLLYRDASLQSVERAVSGNQEFFEIEHLGVYPAHWLTVYESGNSKQRFGAGGDGGYVVDALDDYDQFVSCGAGHDISFEIGVLNHYQSLTCDIYDGNVDNLPGSHPRLRHVKKNIGQLNNSHTTSLVFPDAAFNNALLKMDIEGGEYDWLSACPVKELQRYRQIVIELHNAIHPANWFAAVRLDETHLLVHLHGNNFDRAVQCIDYTTDCIFIWVGHSSENEKTLRLPVQLPEDYSLVLIANPHQDRFACSFSENRQVIVVRRLDADHGWGYNHTLCAVPRTRLEKASRFKLPWTRECTYIRRDALTEQPRPIRHPLPLTIDYPNSPDQQEIELNAWPYIMNSSN